MARLSVRARRAGPLALAAGVVFVLTSVAFMRVPLLPDIGRDVHLSARELGLVTAVFAVGRLAVDVPAGWVADRVSSRILLGTAAGLTACASGLLAAADGIAPVAAALGLLGAGTALANTTGTVVFATRADAAARGTAMAGFATALMTGQMLGPALGGALAGLTSWRAAVLAGAVLAAGVALVCGALFRRERAAEADARSRGWATLWHVPGEEWSGPLGGERPVTAAIGERAGPRGEDGSGSASGDRAGPLGGDESDALGRDRAGPASAERAAPPGLGGAERLALASVGFSTFFALGALPQTLVPIMGSSELGLSGGALGAAAAAAGLARLGGALITGRVSDRVSRRAALIPTVAGMAASVAILAAPLTLAGWLAALVLLSLTSAGMSAATTILADRTPVESIGRRFGAFRLTGDLGLLAGPATAAFVYEYAGRAPAVLLVSALLAASAVACAAVVARA